MKDLTDLTSADKDQIHVIPVISLWMPWANWVACGWKTIETRTHNKFASLLGKTIGIHAAIKWDKLATTTARNYLTGEQVAVTENFLRIGGAIICIATVAGYRKLGSLADSRRALIDCECTERYGLFLENVQSIEAVPSKGHQGIWYEGVSFEDK